VYFVTAACRRPPAPIFGVNERWVGWVQVRPSWIRLWPLFIKRLGAHDGISLDIRFPRIYKQTKMDYIWLAADEKDSYSGRTNASDRSFYFRRSHPRKFNFERSHYKWLTIDPRTVCSRFNKPWGSVTPTSVIGGVFGRTGVGRNGSSRQGMMVAYVRGGLVWNNLDTWIFVARALQALCDPYCQSTCLCVGNCEAKYLGN